MSVSAQGHLLETQRNQKNPNYFFLRFLVFSRGLKIAFTTHQKS
jgi:hypothetical protein